MMQIPKNTLVRLKNIVNKNGRRQRMQKVENTEGRECRMRKVENTEGRKYGK